MVKGNRIQCPYEDCGRDYLNSCNLRRHINFHHLKRAFVCPLCQKGLSSRQNRDEHMSSHTGDKPYKCPYPNCDEKFRQASQLSLHKKLHRMIRDNKQQACPELGDVQSQPLSTSNEETFVPPFVQMPLPWNLQQEHRRG